MTEDQQQKIKQFIKKLPRTLTKEEILQVVRYARDHFKKSTKTQRETYDEFLKQYPYEKEPSYTSWRKVVTTTFSIEELYSLVGKN